MSKGTELWNKSKKIIPGGSQLLSKRSEMFLPDIWPSYYKKAKGVTITDIDGNEYIDYSIMGVGSCILGYSNDEVDNEVINVVKSGNMSTLNNIEEVLLSEELIKSNPWASMVRLAKTGGEAMTIAVRIARASSGKDKVAFCGYHGWHDWYLAANLNADDNLDELLIPGLKPIGVPKSLKGTALPFRYNQLDELRSILENNPDVGTIVIETIRYEQPDPNFLPTVRKLADEYNCVLVFDEITTGFRLNSSGAYKVYGVEPDIAVYAKALGNGYPIAAIVGKGEIMDIAQESFISSTYWTERLGPAAALKTLEIFERDSVQDHLIKIGNKIFEGWQKLGAENELKIHTSGIAPLAHFAFEEKDGQALRTYFTQLMLDKGYLASNSVYVSLLHTEENLAKYLESVNEVFGIVSKVKDENPTNYLKGPIAHTTFKRLN